MKYSDEFLKINLHFLVTLKTLIFLFVFIILFLIYFFFNFLSNIHHIVTTAICDHVLCFLHDRLVYFNELTE